MRKIGFIGAGNMAEAIIKGLCATGEDVEIRITNRSNEERLKRLAETYGVLPAAIPELVQESEVLFLAVKPKDIVGVLKSLRDYQLEKKLIISVAAGIRLETLEKYLSQAAVIRAMPNTSSAVLHSMTGLAKGKNTKIEHVQLAEKIFASIGKVLWIMEDQMNVLTALSGSGPAYFYLFTESLIKAGVRLGLEEKDAEILARETIIGAGKMLEASGKSPSRLREEVTSPKGTTEAALKVFWQADMPEIVFQAARAAAKRGEEMEGEYSN